MKRVRIRPLGFPFLLNAALPAAPAAPGMTLRQAFFCTRRAMGPISRARAQTAQRPAPGPPKCKKMWLPLSTGGKYGILFVKF